MERHWGFSQMLVEGLFPPLNGPELEWFSCQFKSAIIQFPPVFFFFLPVSWRHGEVQTITVSLVSSFPPLFISSLSSSLNGADRSLNSSFLREREVDERHISFSGGGKGWMQTSGGEIQTRKFNTPEHFTHSFEPNKLPQSQSLCVVRRKSCAKFIFRWNYPLRFSCFLSIIRSSLSETDWPAVWSMEVPGKLLLVEGENQKCINIIPFISLIRTWWHPVLSPLNTVYEV